MKRVGLSGGFNGGFIETHTLGRTKALGVLPVGAATAGAKLAELATKLKPVAKFIAKAKALVSKLVGDRVSQKRFIARYTQIRDIFIKAGYLTLGSTFHNQMLDKHRIRKTLIKDHRSNYRAEFQRLRAWAIDILNNSNPGLGTDFASLVPEFKMESKGNIYPVYDDIIKEIVNAIPPKTYIAGSLPQIVKAELPATDGKATTASATEQFITELESGVKVVKDAQGNILQIRDAAGKLLNPGSPEYTNATKEHDGYDDPKQAGFGLTGTIAAIVGTVGVLTLMVGAGKKKPPTVQR